MEDFQDLKKMASIYEYRCAKKIKVSGCVSTKIESNDTIPTKIKINSVKKSHSMAGNLQHGHAHCMAREW